MKVHLLDGTYELFRYFYGAPSHVTSAGEEIAAVRGVLGSVLTLLDEGATHVGVATDHVIESFRNDLWPGYKTSAGMDPVLLGQFDLLEETLRALGVAVWAMVEREADDALGSAALVAGADPAVEQVVICTPDKDLGQCVVGTRVIQLDRRRQLVFDEAGVQAKFGVPPRSIPDYLALVGDSADGFPGIKGFGAKTAAAVLARYGYIEDIPDAPGQWDVPVRGAPALAASLRENREHAALFKELATLRTDPPVIAGAGELRWTGPTPEFPGICRRIDAAQFASRAVAIAKTR